MQWIDTHAHLTSSDVLPRLEGIIERAKKCQIARIINVCTDETSLAAGILLEKKHHWIQNAAATTPHDADRDAFEVFAKAAREKKLVAIGETGLDYYYHHSKKEAQKKSLVRYLNLATECHLPIIFHCRDAFDDLFAIADAEYSKGRAILHCFTGSYADAKRGLDRGWMISLSGILTFKKSESLREVARAIPLSSILIETDTPYLAPLLQRGKPNEPSFLPEIAECLASIKNVSLEEIADIIWKNAETIFPSEKNISLAQ
jgi:TatD DNase family protein